jgi:hypothetical protein
MNENVLLGKKVLEAYLKPDSVGLTLIVVDATGSREKVQFAPPILYGDSHLYASAIEPLRELIGKTVVAVVITDYTLETSTGKTHKFTISLDCHGKKGPWHYVFDWEYETNSGAKHEIRLSFGNTRHANGANLAKSMSRLIHYRRSPSLC